MTKEERGMVGLMSSSSAPDVLTCAHLLSWKGSVFNIHSSESGKLVGF